MTPFERVREICLGFPEVSERPSHGELSWFCRNGRQFAMFADHHHDDRVAVWCACTAEVRDAWIEEEPERFFVPPYVGTRGWIGIWLDRKVPKDLADLLGEAYGLIAPKRR